jgi:hypothetical protein
MILRGPMAGGGAPPSFTAVEESCSVAAVKARAASAFSLVSLFALLGACGGAPASGPSAQSPAGAPTDSAPAAPTPPPALPVAAQADVEISEPGAATVRGARVAFDGIEEGLVWPALDKALPPRKAGDVLTVQVARSAPVIALLRAAWTLRLADLHVQSQDSGGTMHAVEILARRKGAGSSGCHLAVFLRPDGSLRVASPGGPVSIGGDDAPATLAKSLGQERAKCPIKYVAFGAESDGAPWGPVFDVILAVDGVKAAGDARYVLGQAMHTAPAAP